MNRFAGIAAAAAFSLAACGGGGSSSVPSTSKPANTGVGQLAFSIVIPLQTPASAARRKPAYVSPATQSVSFQVGSSTPQVVTLTLGSATCPLTGGGYTCTADANVAAGANQTLTIKTFASTDGSGAVLSQNTIMVTVVAGQTNPVTVSLNGVAASLALALTPSSSVTRCTPSAVTVTWSAKDASGDTIVGPGTIVAANGTPVAPALTASDPVRFTVGAPAGNTWNVAYTGAGGGPSVTLSATNPGVITGTAQLTVNPGSLLFALANTGMAVNVYAPPYTGAPTAVTNGVNLPAQVLVNSSCTLFVANYGNGGADTVTAYAPPYTGAPIATISTTDARDLAISATGNLFIMSATPTSTVTEYAPPYTGSPIATITLNTAGGPSLSPLNIGLDSAADLFLVSDINSANFVSMYSPPYTGAATFITAGTPQRIAVQSGTNDLFVTNDDNPQTAYAPPYTGGPFATIQPGANLDSAGLALDAAGDLFVAFSGSGSVVEYAPPYTGGAAATITGLSTPTNVAVDQATGNLFVANVSPPSNFGAFVRVTAYAPPYTAAPFLTLNTVGRDGALAVSP